MKVKWVQRLSELQECKIGTKNDCAGEDQNKFTRPDQ
jgi:hypothetical protein